MDALVPAVAAPAPRSPSLWSREHAAASLGAVALVSLLAFEAVALAAVMPAIAEALGGDRFYALAFGGLLASSVLGMVWAGSACDRLGPRRVTLQGLAWFALGLLAAACAPGMLALAAARVLQGLGGGMLGVALYVGSSRVVPASLHPRLFALFAAAWVLPALFGPALAAWLVSHVGWPSVFWSVLLALPPAGFMVLRALARLPAPAATATEGPTGSAARPGPWAWGAAAGALLLHASTAAGAERWNAGLLLLGLGLTLVAARRLLPEGSLRARRGVAAVVALRGLIAAAFATAEVFLPLWLNRRAQWSLVEAGLALSLGGVMWSAGSWLQARVSDAARRQQVLRLGFGLMALALAAVLAATLQWAPAALVLPAWAVCGLGIGLAFPMLSVLLLARSAAEESGRNAASLQVADALASSAALAAAGWWFARLAEGPAAYAGVFALAMLLALACAALAPRA